MKSSFLILFLLFPFLSAGQCFQKGTLQISLGLDLGAYQTVGKDKNGIKNKDGAVSSILQLGAEYAITEKWGAGVQLRGNNYGQEDSTLARNTDLSLFSNLHFFTTNYFNFYVGMQVGYSSFRFESSKTQQVFTSPGMHFQANTGVQLFAGRHIGFILHFAYNHLHFLNGEIQNADGSSDEYKLSLNGVNIGTGIIVKINP